MEDPRCRTWPDRGVNGEDRRTITADETLKRSSEDILECLGYSAEEVDTLIADRTFLASG